MPTSNPRINVTLSMSLDLLVMRLATMQRTSKSQVLRELLEAAEPALQRAVALMEAADRATANVHEGLARSLSEAQDLAEAQLAGHIERIDSMTSDLVAQAEGVRGRRAVGVADAQRPLPPPPAAPKRASTPRPVTRGVGMKKGVERGSR